MRGAAVVMPAAPRFYFGAAILGSAQHRRRHKKTGTLFGGAGFTIVLPPRRQAAGLGMRLRELRWKNSAWLATADTIAGWKGFEIRNAGSGRSPVRKRSG